MLSGEVERTQYRVWRTPGWVSPTELADWTAPPLTADAPGWSVAYRRHPETGQLETEWWMWWPAAQAPDTAPAD